MELLIEFVVDMIISCTSLELFDKKHTLSPAHMQSASEAMRQNCTQHLRTDSTGHEGLSGLPVFLPYSVKRLYNLAVNCMNLMTHLFGFKLLLIVAIWISSDLVSCSSASGCDIGHILCGLKMVKNEVSSLSHWLSLPNGFIESNSHCARL